MYLEVLVVIQTTRLPEASSAAIEKISADERLDFCRRGAMRPLQTLEREANESASRIKFSIESIIFSVPSSHFLKDLMSPDPLVSPNLDKAKLAQASEAWLKVLDDMERMVLVWFGVETAKEESARF